MSAAAPEQPKLNLLMLGDSMVGKTSLMYRFVEEKFQMDMKHTVGMAFLTKMMDVNGSSVKVQVWDTAGQERFASVTTSFFRAANGVLVIFDVTNDKSFASVKRWIQHVKELKPDVPLAVVGNKCDLERAVTKEASVAFCAEMDLEFYEASALDGKGVQESFQRFVERMHAEKAKESKPRQSTINPADAARAGPPVRKSMCLLL